MTTSTLDCYLEPTSWQTWETFLEDQPSEFRTPLLHRLETIQLSTHFLEALQSIEKRTLLTFSALFCPDCQVIVPILAKTAQANTKIALRFIPWSETAKDDLRTAFGVGKIPTVLALDDKGSLMPGVFIERPLKVHQETTNLSPAEKQRLISRFRRGECNDAVEKDLLRILRGEEICSVPYIIPN